MKTKLGIVKKIAFALFILFVLNLFTSIVVGRPLFGLFKSSGPMSADLAMQQGLPPNVKADADGMVQMPNGLPPIPASVVNLPPAEKQKFINDYVEKYKASLLQQKAAAGAGNDMVQPQATQAVDDGAPKTEGDQLLDSLKAKK